MSISIFDLFSIGIGPSNSHTVGPMRAAQAFIRSISELQQLTRIKVELFGSLALTGKGHGADLAVLMGLEGELPENIDPKTAVPRMREIIADKTIILNKQHPISFQYEQDLIFNYRELLPHHTNGMHFSAWINDRCLHQETFYSIGGGFIVTESDLHSTKEKIETPLPYNFHNAKTLFELCENHGFTVAELMIENEKFWRDEASIRNKLLHIAKTMEECVNRGCTTEGILPGGLNVKRRAPGLIKRLTSQHDNKYLIDNISWLNAFAMAVNEENAAGGRVVTAPTNGAAGIIPAVLTYYQRFIPDVSEQGVINFLLTAAAIGILYKKGASISGAEVGCQGEVGVACSMAAGAFAAVLGGTLVQIENAAEIAMEHHLGLTCDPIAGLVQIPCIERNALGAVKAVNAAQLALMEETKNKISLDKVIATMLQTGKDMNVIYKETSLGGLAANIPEC